MEAVKSTLEKLLMETQEFLLQTPIEGLEYKPSENKWSKKEILGHLIDSGINNLQRFTEIQFAPKPYTVRDYNQDQLVKANDYQNSVLSDILELWLGLNMQILKVIDLQTDETLKFKILLSNGKFVDLEFLIKDYTAHMQHHLNQIMN